MMVWLAVISDVTSVHVPIAAIALATAVPLCAFVEDAL